MSLFATDHNILVRDLINETIPLGQFEGTHEEAIAANDLGLGFAYYTLARITKPENIVVIGSYRGFSVICFAMALLDNGIGRLHFIDASIVDDFWTDPARASALFEKFGVSKFVSLYNLHTDECLKFPPFNVSDAFIDILLIDGDHRRDAVRHDFVSFGRIVREGGLICLHDSLAGGVGKTPLQVAEYVSSLHDELYESLSLDCAKGLTIIKKLRREHVALTGREQRDEIVIEIDKLIAGTERVNGNTDELRRIRQILVAVLEQVTQDERLLEVRHRYLTMSAKSVQDQVIRLKAELKLLKSQRAPPSGRI